MSNYALTVFIVCVLAGVLGKISYGGKNDISRIAISVISMFVIITPLVNAAKEINIDSIVEIDGWQSEEIEGGYEAVAESAFAKGIGRAVSEKFSLDSSEIKVSVYGFDFEKMFAEEIKITLSGRSVSADYRAIEKYVNSMEIGECEVAVEFR